jgi:hypothetical protein
MILELSAKYNNRLAKLGIQIYCLFLKLPVISLSLIGCH